MEISVVIPAFNESACIGQSIEDICAFFQKHGACVYEVIVVDDGSRDNTAGIVSAHKNANPAVKLIRNDRNYGKGYSIRAGVLAASGDFVLLFDADGSAGLSANFPVFWAKIKEGYDIVIGSRGLSTSRVIKHQAFVRETMGKVFNRLVRMLTHLPFYDTQCGFKLFKSAAAKNIFGRQKIRGFAFDVEALLIAARSGYKILEYPVSWINGKQTRVNLFGDSLKMLADLVKIRRTYGVLS